jgi:aminoglycoside phosphotransferase (APT) family kinase protein
MTALGSGSDCAAWLIDGRVVLKCPLHARAAASLEREARLLALLRPAVRLRVPDLTYRPGSPPSSRHDLIPGVQLLAPVYNRLGEAARDRLAHDLAQFHLDCHSVPAAALIEAGAGEVDDWPDPTPAMADAAPPALRPLAREILDGWQALPPDPEGTVWGHFDAHGWNMAFDPASETLNGIYDFGDSGFGPLHRDLCYSALVSSDLTERLGRAYTALSGRLIDLQRLRVLSGAHRLWELAAASETDRPFQIAALERWAACDPP